MTWWLPSTWFEDLGSARRVSRYQVEDLLTVDGEKFGIPRYVASCYIIAKGRKMEIKTNFEESIGLLSREHAMRYLKEKIRKRYKN